MKTRSIPESLSAWAVSGARSSVHGWRGPRSPDAEKRGILLISDDASLGENLRFAAARTARERQHEPPGLRSRKICARPGRDGGMIVRLNLSLLAILIVCALSLVTSQNKARKLYVELQKEQELAKQLDVEWGQLQLEQSTWAMHARVEKIARDRLHMSVPDAKRTQVVMPAAGARR